MADSGKVVNEMTDTHHKGRGRGRKRYTTTAGKQSKKAKKDSVTTSTSNELPVQHITSQPALSVLPTLQTGLQPSPALLQPAQTMARSSVPCDNTSLASFTQFTVSPNVFAAPLLNSTLQPTLQHVPSSLTSPHASTLGLLNSLNDDKLGIILPVLVRMEHKIDQLIQMLGPKSGSANEEHLNTAKRVNQSNAAISHNNKLSGPSVTTSQPSKAGIQANARLTVAQLFDSLEENEEDDSDPDSNNDNTFNATKSLPGMTSQQHVQLEMAKITEKTLPDDMNFPMSREDLITLQARSTSTMNFAVRLLRELFTRDELIGRNISGVRGKEKVDPARIEIIKEIVFKIYHTSPSDRELLWRYCRKAMDSFLRKMQRPIEVVKDQYEPPSFAKSDKHPVSIL